jgi:hypothetical protein
MESGDSFLFDEQVISMTSQGREHSYSLIIEAIKRAVRASFNCKQTRPTQAPAPEPAPALEPAPASAAVLSASFMDDTPQQVEDRVHGAEEDAPDPQSNLVLLTALRIKFSTADAAYSAFSKHGTIGKKEWRRMIRKTLPRMTIEDAKQLIKKGLPKKLSRGQFVEWMGEEDKKGPMSQTPTEEASNLAGLPIEVPILPSSFKARPHAHEQLILALLESGGRQSTSVTAPKSRVPPQGNVTMTRLYRHD